MEGTSTSFSPVNPKFFKKTVFQMKLEPCPKNSEFRLLSIIGYDKIHIDHPKDVLLVIGHHYHFTLEWKEGGIKKKFESTVKITHTTPKSSNRSLAEMTLVQFKKEMWDGFLNLIDVKQKEVTELLQQAKGMNV